MSLSRRGERATKPALSYFGKFMEGAQELFDANSRPDGYALFAVAENRQTFPLVADKLRGCRGDDPGVGAYGNMAGRERFRSAFATLMSSTAVRATVHPDSLCVGSGCGGLINELAFLLLDAGDACLLPTPTYGALYNDFSVLADVTIVDVPTEGEGFRVTLPALDAATARATAAGHPPRLLFLINPGNPHGVVMGAEEVAACIAWARGKGMHVVVDEIYANSVWGGGSSSPPFFSVVDVCVGMGGLGDDVHVLWGISKDFCLSGFRVGVLYTGNARVLTAMSNTNYFTSVSHDTQDALGRLMEDVGWCKSFFKANHVALAASYAVVTAALDRACVPYLPASAGMFVWVDLRELLPTPPASLPPSPAHLELGVPVWGIPAGQGAVAGVFDGERALLDRLFAEARILFTPGEACHAGAPGFFRICFAWMPLDALEVGMARLVAVVEQSRAGAGRA